MSIIPARPSRPAQPTATATQELTGTPIAIVVAGQTIYGHNIAIRGEIPTYYHRPGYGTPLVVVAHEFRFDWVLQNEGTIWSYSSEQWTTTVWADRVVNSGLIVAEAESTELGPSYTLYGSAFGIVLLGAIAGGPDGKGLENSGSILAFGTRGNAYAVHSQNPFETITNSGVIAAQSTYGEDKSQTGGAYGLQLWNGGYVVNRAGASILAEGPWAVAVHFGRGAHPASQYGPQLINAGLIEAVSTEPARKSIGVELANLEVEHMTIENSGIIRADIAVSAPSSGAAINTTSVQNNIQTVRNLAGGLIDGDIELELGADVLENRGTIVGTVKMGGGDDRVDNTAGTINGLTDLGGENDRFLGGAGMDAVMGQMGNDTIEGAGGNDLLIGGYGDDLLIGGAGNDGLYGEAGEDRFQLAGGDFASGGIGFDRFEASDYAFARIEGGDGLDTWVLPAGDRAIDLGAVAASGRVKGIDAIQLAGGKTLALAAADVAAISDSKQLTIIGTPGDTVRLIGTWIAQPIVPAIPMRFTSGDVTVQIDQGVNVVLSGTAEGLGGLDAIAPGDAAPTPESVPGAALQTKIVVAQYIAFADLIIGQGEEWVSPNGGVVLSAQGYNVTIFNNGKITSRGDPINGLGTAIAFGPASNSSPQYMAGFNNNGVILAEADKFAIAFFSGGLGALYNNGEIRALSKLEDATGAVVYESGVLFGYAANNYQDGIISASSDEAFATGIRFGNTGNLHNSGLIEAHGGDGAAAVDMWNAGGILLNDGEIRATAPITSNYYAIGVYFSLNGALTNTGVIDAELAVYIDARYGGQSSITNSGEIRGAIAMTSMDDFATYDRLTITNSGSIHGDIIMLVDGLAADRIVNTGLIDGLVGLGAGNDLFDGSGGVQTGPVSGQGGDDTLIGGADQDELDGGDGNDRLVGGAGNDELTGGSGSNLIDGGAGTDALPLDGPRSAYTAMTLGSDLLLLRAGEIHRVSNVEIFDFRDGVVSSATVLASAPRFDPLRYTASYPDLIAGFGLNQAAATDHFLNAGFAEGRKASFDPMRYVASYGDLIRGVGANADAASAHYIAAGFAEGRNPTLFDPLRYIASYADLTRAFGMNADAGTMHYVQWGYGEGRRATFDPLRYIASYTDLTAAFHTNGDAALRHYLSWGANEGRTASFDPLRYIASYSDLTRAFHTDGEAGLRHYLNWGFDEGRRASFDPLRYIASYRDLTTAFGSNADAGLRHYLNWGFDEGRKASFDPLLYIASYSDLTRAFGANADAGVRHYLNAGYGEGRQATFDPVGYLLSYGDLGRAGIGAGGALNHWLLAGYREGRVGDALFGREQTSHAIAVGGEVSGAIDRAGDRDWFQVQLSAGQHIELTLDGTGFDGSLAIHDSGGKRVAFAEDGGPGAGDAELSFTAGAAGLYYLVAAANSGTGGYQLEIAG